MCIRDSNCWPRMRGTATKRQSTSGRAVISPQSLSLIHISEPTRQAEISYAVFCLKRLPPRSTPLYSAAASDLYKRQQLLAAYAGNGHKAAIQLGQGGHIAPESVSYTHLRAHETGRNLVCRLLLEK